MKADPATKAEILKIMNRMLNAFARNDLDAFMNHFLSDPNVSLFGQNAEERYVGFDEIRSYYKQMVDQADPRITNILIELVDPIVSENGNVAWIATGLKIKFEKEGNKVNIYSRNTTVFLKQNEKWLVVHIHSSTPMVE